MIRAFTSSDLATAKEIYLANGLPENCFPNLYVENGHKIMVANPLFVIKAVRDSPDGKPAMMAFCKLQGEIFLLLDHTVGTPEERWQWLQEFKKWFAHEAWMNGIEQLSAWLPPEVDESFGKRMEEMGFVKSPYVCWTLNL